MASFAISQQPLPWPCASTPPPLPSTTSTSSYSTVPSLPPPPSSGTAKRIRIKRETCFSLSSRFGPMTSPLQLPAPGFQTPSAFFLFAVNPPFYLNSSILYQRQQRVGERRVLQLSGDLSLPGNVIHDVTYSKEPSFLSENRENRKQLT